MPDDPRPPDLRSQAVRIGPMGLPGEFVVPARAGGIVVFAHGSGSSRLSPRNRHVARILQAQDLATLLFDLLDEAEALDRARVFDIPLLARRLGLALDHLGADATLGALPIGLFGASTGAAAALVAAADRPADVAAVVSRGGRPDLALERLPEVRAPTLLIVGGRDVEVLELNRRALAALDASARLEVVPGATHLFEEPGTLDVAAALAARWFRHHLLEPIRS
jgi:pimeloyl-ACP methyl ester carboxylesterase